MNADIDIELAAESLKVRIRSGNVSLSEWSDWLALLGARVMSQVIQEMQRGKATDPTQTGGTAGEAAGEAVESTSQ